MERADLPPPLDARTTALRLWWGRSVLAFTAAASAYFGVVLVSNLFDGGASVAEAARAFFDNPTFWINLLGVLVVAPFVETALMAWILGWLSKGFRSRTIVMLVSAFLWAGVHRVFSNESGWFTFLSFLAFSFVYLKRSRETHDDGFVVATMCHFFYNALTLLSMLAIRFTR